jgi:hypothetical protein
LIPLVKDGVASNESTRIVNEHVKNCSACKSELDTFETIRMESPSLKDKKIIFDIKRSVYISQIVILVLGAILGIALSSSMGMFYNFIIMPIIGGISYILFKRKWVLAALAIFVVTYLWQTILVMAENGYSMSGLTVGLYYSVIYTVLVVLGAVIAGLLKFAFEKGENDEK